MDDLRTEIWDHLYRIGGSQPIFEIAQQLGRDPLAVHAAVDHQWFGINGEVVAIAQNDGTAQTAVTHS